MTVCRRLGENAFRNMLGHVDVEGQVMTLVRHSLPFLGLSRPSTAVHCRPLPFLGLSLPSLDPSMYCLSAFHHSLCWQRVFYDFYFSILFQGAKEDKY